MYFLSRLRFSATEGEFYQEKRDEKRRLILEHATRLAQNEKHKNACMNNGNKKKI